MPQAPVKIAPGVNAEITAALGTAQIIESQLIRFKFAGADVLPEKLGGWSKYYANSMGSPVRDLHAWEGINADIHLAAGCEESLNVITEGDVQDITPETLTSSAVPAFTTVSASTTVQIDDSALTASFYDSIFILVPVAIGGIVLRGAYSIDAIIDFNSYTVTAATAAGSSSGPGGVVPTFTTVNGSAFVTVALTNHGYSVGSMFSAPVPTTVGGITILGAYIVQEVASVNSFTIIASDAATSGATVSMNGGDVDILYFTSGGPTPPTAGYGAGTYGSGAYGIGTSVPATPGTPITATNWTLDNWGEVLIATPSGGSIYTWSPDSGFPVAVRIVQAPLIQGGAFVAQPEQIVVSWASSFEGVQDPLSVNWSDAGNYNNWTVSSQTQAGGFRIPTGSKIVGGCAGPSFNILWTDVGVWAMDYINPPLIFGFNSIADSCGLIAQHGYAILNTEVYWMGPRQFFRMSGENVQAVPCSVWDVVFQNLDTANASKIHAGANSLFGEVWFFYPTSSGGTEDCDAYVKFNPALGTWDYGALIRTAWIDQSPVGEPVAGDVSGFLYQHEISPNADGEPMDSWFRTGFFQIAEGEQLTFIDWMFPDFRYGYKDGSTQGAILQVSVEYCDYPSAAVKTAGPFSVSSATDFVNMRLRGRLVRLLIRSNDLGSFWRLGLIHFRSAGDGRR